MNHKQYYLIVHYVIELFIKNITCNRPLFSHAAIFGLEVELLLCLRVGSVVGAIVGLIIGFSVGWTVGILVGSLVGGIFG